MTTKTKQHSIYRKIRKAAMATALGTAVLLTPTSINTAGTEKFKSVVRINETEADAVVNEFYKSNMYAGLFDRQKFNTFMSGIFKEAEWASMQCGVSKKFLLSHWFMESGMLNSDPSYAIENNNLAGLMRDGKLIKFDSLHDFAKAYVNTLKSDGVTDMNNPFRIIVKLEQSRYFVNESSITYGSKVLGTMKKIRNVSPGFYVYWYEFDREMSSAYSREDAYVNLRR